MPSTKPGSSATPYRLTVHTVGEPRSFPYYADAAFDTIRAATLWSNDAPLPEEVVEHLDDRAVVIWALARVLLASIRRGGDLYLVDDNGHQWSILGPTVLAIEVTDPENTGRRERPKIGFKPAEPTNV